MSSKVTLKSGIQATGQASFHLYEDNLDGLDDTNQAQERPVYLKLDGIKAQMETLATGGASVTVTIPRAMAEALGLIPAS